MSEEYITHLMAEAHRICPEIQTHINQWMQTAYNDGLGLFNSLQLHHQALAGSADQTHRYGRIPNQKEPVLNVPEIDSPALGTLMPTTYQGFMISARWPQLAREHVRGSRFYRHTMSNKLSGELGKNRKPSQSPQKIESPERYLLAWNHARAVLGLLQSHTVLGTERLGILLEDAGLYDGEQGDSIESFLDELFDAQPTTSTQSLDSVSWTGDGTTESVVKEVVRLNRLVRTALTEPDILKAHEVQRGHQFFTVGQSFWNNVALAGADLASFYERVEYDAAKSVF